MADLDASLGLDIRSALGEVDRLDRALGQAGEDLERRLRDALGGLDRPVADLRGDLTRAADEFGDTLRRATSGADVDVDLDEANRDARRLEGQMGDVNAELRESNKRSRNLGRALKGALAAVGAREVLRAINDTVQAASSLQAATSKAQEVFGEQFATIKQGAEESTAALVLASDQYLETAANIGGFFVAQGLAEEKSADLAKEITNLAADIASFNDIPVAEAVQTLQSGLAGEIEPLRRLGISFDQAAVEAKALELGLADTSDEISRAAELQARAALIFEQSTITQGNLARTTEELANQQRILKAEFREVQIGIGQELLPVAQELVGAARDEFLPALEEMGPTLADLASTVGELAVPTFQVLLDLLQGLTPVLNLAADALGAIPSELLALGVAAGSVRRLTGALGARGAGGMIGRLFIGVTAANLLGDALSNAFDIGAGDPEQIARGLEDIAALGASDELNEAVGGVEGIARILDELADPSLAENIGAGISRAVGVFGNIIGQQSTVQQMEQDLENVDRALANLAAQDPDAASRSFSQIAAAAREAGVPMENIIDALPRYTDAAARAIVESSELPATLSDLASAAGETAAGGIDALTGGAFDLAGAFEASESGADDAKSSVEELNAAIDEHLSLQKELIDPIFAVQQAQQDVAEAEAKVNTLREEGRQGTEEFTDAVQAAVRERADFEASALRVASELEKEGRSVDDITGRISELGRRAGLSADDLSPLLARVRDLVGTARDLPGEVGIDVTADTELAQAKLQELLDTQNRVRLQTSFRVVPGGVGRFLEGAQTGEIVRGVPGGVPRMVAEGVDEAIIPLDSAPRARQLAIESGLMDLIGGGSQPAGPINEQRIENVEVRPLDFREFTDEMELVRRRQRVAGGL